MEVEAFGLALGFGWCERLVERGDGVGVAGAGTASGRGVLSVGAGPILLYQGADDMRWTFDGRSTLEEPAFPGRLKSGERSFVNRRRTLLKPRGWSQRRVARKLSVHRSTVSCYARQFECEAAAAESENVLSGPRVPADSGAQRVQLLEKVPVGPADWPTFNLNPFTTLHRQVQAQSAFDVICQSNFSLTTIRIPA